MTMPRAPHPGAAPFAVIRPPANRSVSWHATCTGCGELRIHSQSRQGSVNFFSGHAKPGSCQQERLPRLAGFAVSIFTGSIHGAGRHGYRKRTHVRAACGDAKRPAGEGNNSTHGHYGRFAVQRFLSRFVPQGTATHPVVLLPACEAVLCQRHFSSGPGLPAALTTFIVSSVRTPAYANRAFRATRLTSPAMRRAASFPPTLAGMSCGRERRTQPQPTHASAFGQESTLSFHGDQIAQGSSRSQPVGFVSRS